jgi:CRISPR/Cas system-associated endonuclease Cas1
MKPYLNEYNTSRKSVILKEYGRNIQKLVDHIKTIEDRDKRNAYAHALVELMRQINPAVKDTTENTQKLWDDLFIISRFDLDIDSPFPKPDKEILDRKPKKVAYSDYRIKYKHYGRNLQLMIDKAVKLEDESEKQAAVVYIGKLMKTFYTVWNKENVEDLVIVENMQELSKNQLEIDVNQVKEANLFETSYKERPQRNLNKPRRPMPPSGGNRKKKG